MIEQIAGGLLFLFGTFIGSFLNVVILRYLNGKNMVTDRSACPRCGGTLRWWELIPILSFVLLRAKCSRCRAPISAQYPIVEFTMGLALVLLGSAVLYSSLHPLIAILSGVAIALLIVLFVIDLYTMLLPDVFVGILTIIAFFLIITRFQLLTTNYKLLTLSSVSGLVIGAGFVLFLYLITKGKGIGFGDVKLMIPLGLIFGGWGAVILLLLSFISGGLVSLALLSKGRATMKTAIPFGPFIAGSAILLLLFPQLQQAIRYLLWPV